MIESYNRIGKNYQKFRVLMVPSIFDISKDFWNIFISSMNKTHGGIFLIFRWSSVGIGIRYITTGLTNTIFNIVIYESQLI